MQKWFINIEVITAKKQMYVFALPISIEGEKRELTKAEIDPQKLITFL